IRTNRSRSPAVQHEAVLEDAVLPDTVLPDAILPDTIRPDAVLPEAILPEAVRPEAVLREAVRPEAVQRHAVHVGRGMSRGDDHGQGDSGCGKNRSHGFSPFRLVFTVGDW